MGQIEKAAFGFLLGVLSVWKMIWENSCILNKRDHSHIETTFSYILTKKVLGWRVWRVGAETKILSSRLTNCLENLIIYI
jgi:hypothetical protein